QEIAKHLLDHGATVNDGTIGRVSSLCVASFEGHVPMVKLLIKRGTSSIEAGRHCRALRLASQQGHIQIMQTLFENDADVHADEPGHGTALQGAISLNADTGIVRLLLKKGASLVAR
ncbi:ankyrin repeat-containing domain protein, partial [Mycena olivaceomarginata]